LDELVSHGGGEKKKNWEWTRKKSERIIKKKECNPIGVGKNKLARKNEGPGAINQKGKRRHSSLSNMGEKWGRRSVIEGETRKTLLTGKGGKQVRRKKLELIKTWVLGLGTEPTGVGRKVGKGK